METTPKIYNLKELLDLYPKKLNNVEALKPPIDYKISPNIFLPIWGQSYKIAKDTFNYLNNLSPYGIKVYVAIFSEGKLKNFVKYIQNPKTSVANSIDKKEIVLDEAVKFTPKDLENLKKKKYSLMNCILQDKPEIEEKHPYHRLLETVGSIPDGMYIFSLRDTLLVRFDNKHPYIGLSNFKKFSKKPSKLLPIFNTTGGKDYMDIPIVEFETLSYVNKLFYKSEDTFEDINLDWESKKPIALFRGGATGCGYNSENNQRLKLEKLYRDLKEFQSKFPENKDLLFSGNLDIGITSISKKYIIDESGKLGFINPSEFGVSNLTEKMSKKEQSNYKYILVVEGNVSAHRIVTDMLFNSVIFLVDSIYNVWVSYLLEPYVHYIPIKSDFSDLFEKIEWCKSNDKKCEAIANESRSLALKVCNIDYIHSHILNGLTFV